MDDLPAMSVPGRAKRPGYHNAKSPVTRGFLYVIYATNKGAVENTCVPIATLTTPAPR